jgi:hypothetical protein
MSPIARAWWSGFLAALGLCLTFYALFLWPAKAHADMCGPTPGLPSYSYPWVKSCRAYVPFTGGLIPAIPVIQPPNGAYPVPFIGGTGGLGVPGWPAPGYSPLTAP